MEDLLHVLWAWVMGVLETEAWDVTWVCFDFCVLLMQGRLRLYLCAWDEASAFH